jgi:uncharacterized membrane protein
MKAEWFFRAGILLKGIDSAFEVLGGILLLMPVRLATWLWLLADHEIYKHHDVLAGRFDHLAETVVTKDSPFMAGYLLVHGLSKVILIYGIFQEKVWGYKGLIVVLAFFTLIEVAQGLHGHEIVTLILAGFDALLVFLMAKEYRKKFVLEPMTETEI